MGSMPDQGSKAGPLNYEGGVLATGPPLGSPTSGSISSVAKVFLQVEGMEAGPVCPGKTPQGPVLL